MLTTRQILTCPQMRCHVIRRISNQRIFISTEPSTESIVHTIRPAVKWTLSKENLSSGFNSDY